MLRTARAVAILEDILLFVSVPVKLCNRIALVIHEGHWYFCIKKPKLFQLWLETCPHYLNGAVQHLFLRFGWQSFSRVHSFLLHLLIKHVSHCALVSPDEVLAKTFVP